MARYSVALARVRVNETASPEVGTEPAIFQKVATRTTGARPSRAIAGNGRTRVKFLFSTAIADAAKEKSPPATPEGFSSPKIRTVLLPEVRTKTPKLRRLEVQVHRDRVFGAAFVSLNSTAMQSSDRSSMLSTREYTQQLPRPRLEAFRPR